jgi:hypothetical protein
MTTLLLGSLVISLLHALLPNHWLPIIAIGRQQAWTGRQVLTVTFWAGLAHIGGTLSVGGILALTGNKLAGNFEEFTHWIMPVVLVLLGLVFLYRHYHHRHFHIEGVQKNGKSMYQIAGALALAMFFSPCLEIEGYFLMAGAYGLNAILTLMLLYACATLAGMLLWVRWAYRGIQKLDWHALEHKAGIITGLTLIATGVLAYFIH